MSGFTVFELLCAICVLSLLLAVAVESFPEALREVSLSEFANEITSHLDQASLVALASQRTARIRLTGRTIETPSSRLKVPKGVAVKFRFGGGNPNLASFSPTGGNSAGTIELTKKRHRCLITLSVSGARRTEC